LTFPRPGPAGLAAATTAAHRGHAVTLYDQVKFLEIEKALLRIFTR
jgi:predicted flavoprotein YhiN